jgi:hypothetical protein
LNFREGLFDVLVKSLVSNGHEVEVLRLEDCSLKEALTWIEDGGFDYFLTGNFIAFHGPKFGRELEEHLRSKNLPCVIWHWEKVFFSGMGYLRKRLEEGPLPKNFLFLVTDRSDISVLKPYGVEAHQLSMGVDDTLRNFKPRVDSLKRLQYDVCFSGTPFLLQGVESSSLESLKKTFVANALMEFYSRAQKLSAVAMTSVRHASLLESLYRVFSVSSHSYSSLEVALSELRKIWSQSLNAQWLEVFDRSYRDRLSYIYSYFQLCAYLKQLRKFDIRIFGSEEWSKYIEGYTYPSPRVSDDDFYAMLSASKISFCLTKLQFHEFVHERPLMTLASGGFPITDFREELYTMFDRDELVSFESIEEAESLIDYYLKHESERLSIVEKGRARVLSNHTYSHRIQELTRLVKDHFGVC